MFERFNHRARRAIVLAQELAKSRHHAEIAPEHLLIACATVPDSVAQAVFAQLEVAPSALVDAMSFETLELPLNEGLAHVPFTGLAKKCLEHSLREALKLGHSYIGTEHLLLGTIRASDRIARQLQSELNLSIEAVYAETIPELARRNPTQSAPRKSPSMAGSDTRIGGSTMPAESAANPGYPGTGSARTPNAMAESAEFDRIVESLAFAPAIADEAHEGEDLLGIDVDAMCLAALSASASMRPPLAIGVYGRWGSGKSYFMKRIGTHIERLSAASVNIDNKPFVSNVRHVTFNAWHYSQGNLWASLLHHIFHSLSSTPGRAETALAALTTEVEGAHAIKLEADSQVAAAERAVADAEEVTKAVESRAAEAAQQARAVRGRDLWDLAMNSGSLPHRALVEDAVRKSGIQNSVSSGRELHDATVAVIALYGRASTLATGGPFWRTPLMLSVYAFLAVTIMSVVVVAALDSHPGWVAIVGQVGAVMGAIAIWLGRQASLASSYLYPAQQLKAELDRRHHAALREQEAELESIRRDLEIAEADLIRARGRQDEAAAELEEAEDRRRQLTPTELLRQYLSERAESGDYENYLGVVGLAHRDLVSLNEYLQLAASDGSDGHAQRIILYVDDLDRCQPETVVHVLEAIHLLLALPLFVVYVGVDPSWLRASLRVKHQELLSEAGAGVQPDQYLEKIFQLTYSLPSVSASTSRQMLSGIASQFVADGAEGRLKRSHISADYGGSPRATDPGYDAVPAEPQGFDMPGKSVPFDGDLELLARAVALSTDDVQTIVALAPLVGRSPRAAKRFLGTLLVARARVASSLSAQDSASSRSALSATLIATVVLVGCSPITQERLADPTADQSRSVAEVLAELASEREADESLRLLAELVTTNADLSAVRISDLREVLPRVRPYVASSVVVE
jgi:hypothetical protein